MSTPVQSKRQKRLSGPTTPTGRKRWTSEMESKLVGMWKKEIHLYDASAKGYRKPLIELELHST